MSGTPMRPFVSRPTSGGPHGEARFVLAPPYVHGRKPFAPVEPELPSIDDFLDAVPPIEQFAPEAESRSQLEADWPSWGGESNQMPEAETAWSRGKWEGYDWGGAAQLGALPPDPGADAWAATDWSEAKERQRSRQSAAEALAQALDQIARRIRAGDLRVPEPDAMQDDAAIAATLAALLGIKR